MQNTYTSNPSHTLSISLFHIPFLNSVNREISHYVYLLLNPSVFQLFKTLAM
jgi:hypothetical protein